MHKALLKLSFFFLLFVAAFAPAACTENRVVVTPNPGDGETPEEDAAVDAGPDATVIPDGPESCDPFEARARTPELFVGPDGFVERMVGLINAAQTSVDLMMYEFDVPDIYDALVAAQQRGVKVRVVLDAQQRNNKDARSALVAAGVELTDAITEFPHYHVKVLILDHQKAVVMSMNFNAYSAKTERNYGVILTNGDDIADLENLVEHDLGRHARVFDLGCTRLVVSPINARARIVEFINKAQKTLDFAAMYISDPEVQTAVKAAQKRGVKVRVLFANPAWIDNNAQTATEFAASGIETRYFGKYDLHAKLMMSESSALIGSENYSSNSLDNNREVGVFVSNTETLAAIRQQFESDWGVGTTAP